MKLDSTYDVISTFKNFGDSVFTFGLHTEITDTLGTVYFTKDSTVYNLQPDSSIEINFGTWSMTTPGRYIYKACTTTKDSTPSNDTLQEMLQADIDLEVSEIVSPTGICDKDIPYDVIARFKNNGLNDETVNLHADVVFEGSSVFTKDSNGVFIPAVYYSMPDYSGPYDPSGVAYARTLVVNQQYEVSIPFGDDAVNKHYLNISQLPDTFGFHIWTGDAAIGDMGGYWPTQGCSQDDPSTYGKLIISGASVGVNETRIPSTYFMGLERSIIYSGYITISYALPRKSDISIGVYDMGGRKVYSFKRRNVKPGWYRMDVNIGRNKPSGVYFIKMEAGSFRDVRKAIILR